MGEALVAVGTVDARREVRLGGSRPYVVQLAVVVVAAGLERDGPADVAAEQWPLALRYLGEGVLEVAQLLVGEGERRAAAPSPSVGRQGVGSR
ncbi:hypothetical protein OG413_32240 [Streptomyces sp. NBC_01433]|uniref:hypothetical protein n=1 Tax=Streptomyces sp. NBC_01433 TaxID=2903864 RepID=UPI0022515B39|nr:hypothetical protein [Streptomyces sp. NBC_01433]MCX4679897.1 hypothetical protein [Streptomyces sp. NBC_01433]